MDLVEGGVCIRQSSGLVVGRTVAELEGGLDGPWTTLKFQLKANTLQEILTNSSLISRRFIILHQLYVEILETGEIRNLLFSLDTYTMLEAYFIYIVIQNYVQVGPS